MNRPAIAGAVAGLTGVFVLLCGQKAPAAGAEMRVLCSNGMKAAIEKLIPEAEPAIGRKIAIQYSASALLKRSIEGGEPFDLAILTPGIIDDLIKSGKVVAGTHTNLASAPLAVGVRAGSPKRDTSTPEAMKRTLLAATSITYTKEGAASASIASMLGSLGIQEALKSRIVLETVPGRPAQSVAEGKNEMVFAPVSEILPMHGVEVLGLFPKEFQNPVVMTAGIGAQAKDADGARALVSFMRSPSAAAAIRASGMQIPTS
jgi:molybdate transport system substrate-binding protein